MKRALIIAIGFLLVGCYDYSEHIKLSYGTDIYLSDNENYGLTREDFEYATNYSLNRFEEYGFSRNDMLDALRRIDIFVFDSECESDLTHTTIRGIPCDGACSGCCGGLAYSWRFDIELLIYDRVSYTALVHELAHIYVFVDTDWANSDGDHSELELWNLVYDINNELIDMGY